MLHQLTTRVAQFVERHVEAGEATPFIVIDLDVVRASYERFRAAFPRVAPHYAIKASPERPILELLRDAGCGFDVASAGEIRTLAALGVAPDRVILANPVKGPRDLQAAREHGVRLVTADTVEELEKLDAYATRTGHSFEVLARLWVPNFGSLIDLSSKFGASEETLDAMFTAARDRLPGIALRGLAFHVGSQCINPASYTRAMELALDRLAILRAAGHTIETLDIGGGIPVDYSRHVRYVDEIYDAIALAVESVPDDVRIIAEPGRTFCATAATLVVQIIGRTERHGAPWYTSDASPVSVLIRNRPVWSSLAPMASNDFPSGRHRTLDPCSCSATAGSNSRSSPEETSRMTTVN